MSLRSRRVPRDALTRAAQAVGGVVVAVAVLVLVGWWANWPILTTWGVDQTAMRPAAATGMLLLAVPVLLGRATGMLAALGAGTTLFFALAALGRVLAGGSLLLDRLVPGAGPGEADSRTALVTAGAITALAGATLAARLGRALAQQALAVLALVVGQLAVLGYLFGASSIYSHGDESAIALPTGLCVALLGAAALLAAPDRGLAALLRDQGTAGRISRQLLPILVVAPPLAGWLRLEGQELGWYETAFGTAILVVALSSITALLFVRTARKVKEADDETALTQRAMVMLNAHLEEAVEERTAELAAVQARLTAAFVSSPLGTAFTAVDGTILEVNPLFVELTSSPAEFLIGSRIDDLFGRENAAEEAVLRATMLAGAGSYAIERPMHRGATTRWVKTSVALIEDEGRRHGTLYHLEDVTARRIAEERVQHLALHDSLTDLPNRLLLLDRISLALAHATRTRRGVGVLFLDLDGFKQVNDRHGHQAGDVVLTEVARRLKASVRLSDTVARLGGDEFVVVCPDMASASDLPTIAGVVLRAVTRPILHDGLELKVGTSIGITFGLAHDEPELLLRQADQAMYRAKERGDGGWALHEEAQALVPTQRLQ